MVHHPLFGWLETCRIRRDLMEHVTADRQQLGEQVPERERRRFVTQVAVLEKDAAVGRRGRQLHHGRPGHRVEDDPPPLPPVMRNVSAARSCVSVAMTCSAPSSTRACALLLGPRQRDRRRTDGSGDLNRRNTHAAGGGGDQYRVAASHFGDVHSRAVRGQVLHPDCGRLLPGKRRRMFDDGRGRNDRRISIDAILA